jgi:hypothetical protein
MVDVFDRLRQAFGERHATPADPNQRELLDVRVALEDLVRDARKASPDTVGVHHDRHRDSGRSIG